MKVLTLEMNGIIKLFMILIGLYERSVRGYVWEREKYLGQGTLLFGPLLKLRE